MAGEVLHVERLLTVACIPDMVVGDLWIDQCAGPFEPLTSYDLMVGLKLV